MIQQLQRDYPNFTFTPGETFMWNPNEQTIVYSEHALRKSQGTWSLLHELGHALLGHTTFKSDLGLVKLEAAAWGRARSIAENIGVKIDENHVQDCLDSYRDWLKSRSTCPECGMVTLQQEDTSYACVNCVCTWQVSESQLCNIKTRTNEGVAT